MTRFLLLFYISMNTVLLCAQTLREDTLEARKLIQKAEKSAAVKEYKRAIQKLDEVLDIYSSHELWVSFFATKINMADYEYKRGKKEEACQLLEDVIVESLDRFEDSNPSQAAALHQKANFLHLEQHTEDAEETYRLACGLYQQITNERADRACMQCLLDFATHLQEAGKYDEAIENLKSAGRQALILFGEEHPLSINIWEKVAVLHYNNEHYISCKNQAKIVLKIRQKVNNGDSPEQYTLYFLLSKSYLFLEEPKIAQEYAEKALEICEKNKDMRAEWAADFYQVLADVYWQIEEFQNAIDLIIKKKKPIVVNLYGSRSPNVAEVYHSLGLYYSDWDRYEKAEEYFNMAIRLYKSLNEKGENLSIVYRNFAVCFDRQGLYEEALDADIKSFLANCPACNPIAPSDFFNRVQELVESNQFLDPLATLYILQDQLQLFYYKYQEEKESADLEKARNVVNAVVWLTERMARERCETPDKPLIYQSARQSYLWGIAVLYELYIIKKEKGYLIEAFNLAEHDKSLRFESFFHNIAPQHLGQIPDSLVHYEIEFQKLLASAEKRYSKALLDKDDVKKTVLYNDYVKMRRERDNAAKLLGKQYPDYKMVRANFNRTELSEIQKKLLDEKTALIEYFVWEDIIYVFSLTATDINCYETDLAGIALKTYVDELQQALKDPLLAKRAPKVAWENFINSSFELYEILLAPAVNDFPEGINQLIIIPDGLLYNFPFEVLLIEDASIDSVHYKTLSYLTQLYAVSYQYTALEALQLQKIEAQNERISLHIFESDYSMDDNAFERNKEVMEKRMPLRTVKFGDNLSEHIRHLFRGKVFSGEAATEQNFKKNVLDAAILQISLFGQPDQTNLMKTALFFTENGDSIGEDNLLYLDEISVLRLQAQLVVLSACEAAYGDYTEGQGIRAFTGSFYYAKVPSVLICRWLAVDKSSNLIMEAFYRYLAKGYTKDEALRQAKLNYLEKASDAMAHPFYWAQFSLFGVRQPLQTKKEISTLPVANRSWWFFISILLIIILSSLGGWWLWRQYVAKKNIQNQ